MITTSVITKKGRERLLKEYQDPNLRKRSMRAVVFGIPLLIVLAIIAIFFTQ